MLLPYHALVGGSTQGIGRAVAEALAETGATVTLISRNEAALREVAAALPTPTQQQHDYLVADFSQPTQVADAVAGYLAA
ncbi:MAG: SDR family NAD(P)-dependent oxidoreductase, partial [Hymenobacter sp.]